MANFDRFFMITLEDLDTSSKILIDLSDEYSEQGDRIELSGSYIAQQPKGVKIPLGSDLFLLKETKVSLYSIPGLPEAPPFDFVHIFLEKEVPVLSPPEVNLSLKIFGKHSIYKIFSKIHDTQTLKSIGDNITLEETESGKLRIASILDSITRFNPENLFKNHPNISSFRYLFSNIRNEYALEYEELPYDLLENGEKLYLWERQGKPGYPSEIDGQACFNSVWKEKYKERSEEAGILEYYNTWFNG